MCRRTLAFSPSFHSPPFAHLSFSSRSPSRSPFRPPSKACLPHTTSQTSTSPSPPSRDYRLAPGEVAVRFINTPSGDEVVAAANPGDPLLRVGDGVGVVIPRACRSGLCASCTCDLVDPVTKAVETVRACQTGVFAEGDLEMVVDVARMKDVKSKTLDPMARFENLDTGYVAGAPPRKRGFTREERCTECTGTGDVECLSCDGAGTEQGILCALCAGTGLVRCAECQGRGIRAIVR